MVKSPLFSIIIPTLNEANYLPKLLEDLLAQKKKDFEVLIIDGKSQDNTKEIALKFANSLNLSFHTVEVRNVSYQRNFGASKAKGDYLFFLDADARLSNALIKKATKTVLNSRYLLFIPSVVPQDKNLPDVISFNLINIFLEASQYTSKPFSSGGTMIVERNFFFHLGKFNEKLYLAEDHELVARAKKMGVTSKFVKSIAIKISLRRLKKEGRLDLYRKYLVASFHTLKNGPIYHKIFEYDMGGSAYKKDNRRKISIEKLIPHYFNILKRTLDRLISE
ncbi:hypothetical protein A3C23_01600 [Candidatus Roizmanbacteria bacterium RIFCSPHIGHO2_02_FULL_37_13b]|uniref:Glycosyltransferase 2-like domain-containing protein n=1 Tax=Candidatus Roizmanbacteria bacterium RIFCSPLOWO2_02_FULL_36_11 TaxID=1802071 RepID=A0A1F7JC73_9BACT|nr:MAG: hypothetical protein A3C23_01600 [Candidatus Roizmanbacteria bacterium RIFCSPHIGHO2_02_FULL_37_13b]OGK53210.1 MAG: hypothetical protein A3H78_02645 [Candidatus Roizmanbacteria bacterium RIFCSPLOWO2_02_FULL_36_11]